MKYTRCLVWKILIIVSHFQTLVTVFIYSILYSRFHRVHFLIWNYNCILITSKWLSQLSICAQCKMEPRSNSGMTGDPQPPILPPRTCSMFELHSCCKCVIIFLQCFNSIVRISLLIILSMKCWDETFYLGLLLGFCSKLLAHSNLNMLALLSFLNKLSTNKYKGEICCFLVGKVCTSRLF